MDEKPKIVIVHGSKKAYAEDLQAAIQEWAQTEIREDISGRSGGLTLTGLEKTEQEMSEANKCVFFVTADDLTKEMVVDKELLFNIFLSYNLIGKRNTILVIQTEMRVVANLFKAVAFITHDFSKKAYTMSNALKEKFGITVQEGAVVEPLKEIKKTGRSLSLTTTDLEKSLEFAGFFDEPEKKTQDLTLSFDESFESDGSEDESVSNMQEPVLTLAESFILDDSEDENVSNMQELVLTLAESFILDDSEDESISNIFDGE